MRTAATSTRIFQFQLMGLDGAFVTGDLFNLFVFFEVLLIASYVLVVHGLGAERLRVGVHYVVLNLAASALFLIGVALLYAGTGTLNLADLALRVPRVAGPDAALLQAAALLLLVVFGFKAALLPLSMWLPATYAAATRAGGGAVRHHDQGRRLRHPARARRGLRRRGRRLGLHRCSRCCCRWRWPPAWSACWARWRRTRCSAWWPG